MTIDVMILSNDVVQASEASKNVEEFFGVTPRILSGAETIAKGYNQLARQSSADVLCFMHQDARVGFPASVLYEYLNWLEKPGIIGFCGSGMQVPGKQWHECKPTYGGLVQSGSRLDFSPVSRFLPGGKLGFQPIHTVDGYCMFIMRSVFERIGGFDEGYDGWHGYDMDICSKSLDAGFQNYVIAQPSSHSSWGSSGPSLDRALSRLKEKWSMLLSSISPTPPPAQAAPVPNVASPEKKGKLKIVVYTICKNERQFVERFTKSCADADGIYVLDTGSTDGTPEALRALGVNVEVHPFTPWKTLEEYDKLVAEGKDPWRFDVARNLSIDMCPDDADVLVCIDLDEILVPGWRKLVEDAWTPGTNHLSYLFAWSMDGDKPRHCFWYEKIHSRKGYVWASPVHEAIVPVHGFVDRRAAVQKCLVQHYPDASKSRAQYLPLLELCVREAPHDPRVRFYLGREYTFVGRHQDAIDSHKHLLSMPGSNCARERSNACQQIAGCYAALKDDRQQFNWLLKAITEESGQREAFVDLADYARIKGDNLLGYWASKKALSIPHSSCDHNYLVDPEAWKQKPHDIASITGWYSWNQNQREESMQDAWVALSYSPWDGRLEGNYRVIQNCLAKPFPKEFMVDVIILSYSKSEREYKMTKEAIQSLRTSSPEVGIRVVVVETNANLANEEFAKGEKDLFGEGVEVCYPGCEFGFNKYLNAGYEYLAKSPSTSRYMAVMNNDVTLFNPGFMLHMIEGLKSVASASPLGLREATWSLVNRNVPIDENYDINRSVNGWFLMFDKKILNALTFEVLFPPRFTWYGGDIHYAELLEKCGYKHGLVNAAQALHLQRQSHSLLGVGLAANDVSRVVQSRVEESFSPPLDRNDMLSVLNLKGKRCVEVGVEVGVYSREILSREPSSLMLVDPWQHQDESVYPNDTSNVQDDEAERRFNEVQQNLGKDPRVTICRTFSVNASRLLEDESIDFVYIDAIHTKASVLEDMASWWPKVKPGGWLCGHDYQMQGVVDAVAEFCSKEGLKITFITKERNPSWAIRKTGDDPGPSSKHEDYLDAQRKATIREKEWPRSREGHEKFMESFVLPRVKDSSRILDCGCGDGVGLELFRKFGFKNVVGVDATPEKAASARSSGYEVHVSDMHDLSIIKDGSMDVVYSSHSLEHAKDPARVLGEFRRILSPDGSLILVLPFPDIGAEEVHCGKHVLKTSSEDVSREGDLGLEKFLSQNGFEVKTKQTDSYRENEIWIHCAVRPNGSQIEILPDCNVAVIAGDCGACSWVHQHRRLNYDRTILDQIVPHIDKNKIAVDIGAFIGSHSFEYLLHASGVVSFEPNPAAFQCLSHNCPKAVKHNVALGERECQRYWTRIYPNCGASYLSDEPSPGCLVVPVRTLDSFNLENVGYMKIDAEGEECAILRGGRETISRCRPVLCMEVNKAALNRTGTSDVELYKQLDALGYDVKTMPGTEYGLQWDILAIPR